MYLNFINNKSFVLESNGFTVDTSILNPQLYDFQKDMTRWALAKGRAAIFADCGLGKTLMQLDWAHQIHQRTGGNILILAPLAVAAQTVQEGIKFGVDVNICESQNDVQPGINITNYEKLNKFVAKEFIGVVLDESSILKSFTGKIRNQIIDTFIKTPYKLACTATPAPNDYMELGNHAEFLGVMSRTEMLSMFFVHDSGETSKKEKYNTEPVYSHQVWRRYASPVWLDIRQGNTLNKQAARDDKDERHICPLRVWIDALWV